MEPLLYYKGYKHKTKQFIMKFATLLLLTTLSASTYAQKSEIFTNKGIAVKGYDVVAYFEESKPVKGSKEHQLKWKDAIWYFSSAENLAKFKEEPQRFAPQYGGYCAYAVANGSTAPIDPDAWSIVDNKLYLNFNKSIQKKWEANTTQHINQADQNWPKVLMK